MTEPRTIDDGATVTVTIEVCVEKTGAANALIATLLEWCNEEEL